MISGFLSPRHGGTATNMEGSCEYFEQTLTNSRQWVVFHLGGYASC